jgi:tRNA pseudouridine55 synthase
MRANSLPEVRDDGVLLLDKPAGMSSNAALQSVRRLMGRIKAGHTGTLDPMATGLLPVCLGEATKFASGLLDADKVYEAVVRLGVATDTGDAEGEVIFRGEWTAAAAQIDEVLTEFRGEIEQMPPMFSAIKHRGRPLYEYARKGQEIERSHRSVRVYEIAILSKSPPDFRLLIRCSKGTYVRTLAHDIGSRLGCGSDQATRRSFVRSVDLLVLHLPAAYLTAVEAKSVLQGKVVEPTELHSASGNLRLYDQSGAFLGVGLVAEGKIVPRRMCSIPLPHRNDGRRLEELSASG